jgi:hypothetical protein
VKILWAANPAKKGHPMGFAHLCSKASYPEGKVDIARVNLIAGNVILLNNYWIGATYSVLHLHN